uniref:Probable DNA polymerase III n=1 Tax=Rhizobium loti TaxID=381 RepID=M5AM02_RHILI|nr:probable DNA polymerase III [Mesorhizobium loti NZP2037]
MVRSCSASRVPSCVRSERRGRDKSDLRDGFQPVRQIVSVVPGDQLLLDRLKSLSQVADQPGQCFEDKSGKLGKVGAFEAAVALRPMVAGREVVGDYGHVGLILREHPIAFLRAGLTRRRIVTYAEAMAARDGRWLEAAGLVLVRQRPALPRALCSSPWKTRPAPPTSSCGSRCSRNFGALCSRHGCWRWRPHPAGRRRRPPRRQHRHRPLGRARQRRQSRYVFCAPARPGR